jgi:hypothetical protein
MSITIGYQRQSDGDIAVLATLSNIDELLDEESFSDLVATTCQTFKNHTGEDIRAWARQDAPDYLFKDDDLPDHWVDVTPSY